jgi:hypothetical protein
MQDVAFTYKIIIDETNEYMTDFYVLSLWFTDMYMYVSIYE